MTELKPKYAETTQSSDTVQLDDSTLAVRLQMKEACISGQWSQYFESLRLMIFMNYIVDDDEAVRDLLKETLEVIHNNALNYKQMEKVSGLKIKKLYSDIVEALNSVGKEDEEQKWDIYEEEIEAFLAEMQQQYCQK